MSRMNATDTNPMTGPAAAAKTTCETCTGYAGTSV